MLFSHNPYREPEVIWLLHPINLHLYKVNTERNTIGSVHLQKFPKPDAAEIRSAHCSYVDWVQNGNEQPEIEKHHRKDCIIPEWMLFINSDSAHQFIFGTRESLALAPIIGGEVFNPISDIPPLQGDDLKLFRDSATKALPSLLSELADAFDLPVVTDSLNLLKMYSFEECP